MTNERPIFFDASGKRGRWSKRLVSLLLGLVICAAVGFAMTVVAVPRPNALHPYGERNQARPLREQIGKLRQRAGKWLPGGLAKPQAGHAINAGFYVPWDPDSKASLARHIETLDWVIPAVASVTDGGRKVRVERDEGFDRIMAAALHKPLVLPLIQNATNDVWDGAGTARMLASPRMRKALLDWVETVILAKGGAGVVFDFEELPPSAQNDYRRFIAEANARFNARNWLVTLAAPLDNPSWDLAGLAKAADRIFLMDYDEHSPGDAIGPIASQTWFVANLKRALAVVPPDKAIVAIGNYAYDWSSNGGTDNLTNEEAWLAANESDAVPRFDPESGNAGFSYEEDGITHTVWMLDAASAWNELRAVADVGVSGIALWRLGSEDPGYWDAAAAYRSKKAPAFETIHPVGNVDVEGSGEILRIEAVPRDGLRHVITDQSGLIRDEQFVHLPTPFVVKRGGTPGKYVALTFDDGPDAAWTPQILDILEAKHAPATFFVVGESAISHPALLNRIIADGSELGSHSYTHPNMARVSDTGIMLELNTTQRLVEAYTGRGMRFFRAPYFGDAEPTTSDELLPALAAQNDGYLNIGLHVDPNDWQRPGAGKIVQSTLDEVAAATPENSRQIVLLHDGGGDRSQTVVALPAIIDGLRARGYTLVPVSRLAGLTQDAAMPKLQGLDLLAVRADIGVFLTVAAILAAIKWMFFLAIALGMFRAILMTILAIRSARNPDVQPPIDPDRLVSVLIPAFNEVKVIVPSIRRVLASEGVHVEVIVIDDGSTDGTGDAVKAAFADNPLVRLLTLTNGGKARALNEGLALTKSDIVIALDADTQFEKTTVAHLARWFADPEIGAVAGNAKVGNRVNLVTRWQGVEYVTAQNLERRALTAFDAITVVPGAVGAWRRAALEAVGGYPVDTLAEDQDLTIAIQRAGWRIGYDVDAVAWTEAPETFRALSKQRFRWAYGTLQCLWKHRAILRERRPAGLALVGIPQAWMFQIVFAMISPVIDLGLLASIAGTALRIAQHGWAQTQSDVLMMGGYWLAFTSVDLACGAVAYWLEPRERRFPAHLLIAQRFVYRQLMYSVVIRAVVTAFSGPMVGWGKLERSGRMSAAQP